MGFTNVMAKIKRMILCCGKKEGQHCIEIGSPTDVRRLDVGEAMSSLTEEDRKFIHEKASTDGIRLLSLQPHLPPPPLSPVSSLPPPQEPSQHLLNAASSNLPPTVPSPPRQKHGETSPPSSRMKCMWKRTRRLSTGLQSHHSGYEELRAAHELRLAKNKDGKTADDSVVMLNVDFDFKEEAEEDSNMDLETPVSGKSDFEGFEAQGVRGGNLGDDLDPCSDTEQRQVMAKNKRVLSKNADTEAAESSGSDGESITEHKPLVKA